MKMSPRPFHIDRNDQPTVASGSFVARDRKRP